MADRQAINTEAAPAAIGPYSQAIKTGNLVYISGQIPLDPTTMELAGDEIEEQTHQVFLNLQAVATAAGADLNNAVKLTIYLTDLRQFSAINQIMASYLKEPYPARATIEVSGLPKGAQVEIDAVLAV
ncbi:MAG: RidA family protein [Pseudohongiellaceae bacterium]|jgi:reactive intermediate/imine deaminase